MGQCKGKTKTGEPCKAWAMDGSEYCWFHNDTVSLNRGLERAIYVDMAKGVVTTQKGHSYEKLFGKRLSNRPRVDRLNELERFYNDGGLVARAIDSYVHVATANGYQLIDAESGERENDNTQLIEELDSRVDFHEAFVKIARSLLNYGYCWGQKLVENKKIIRLNFFPVQEIKVERDTSTGKITKITQVKETKDITSWSGESLNEIFFITMPPEHSETFPKGLLEKIYMEAKQWKDMGEDLQAVTRFVSYPFRVVKVGSDTYPASEEAVTKVGNTVEELEPGDWLATRHNLEFEFHAPEIPEAIVENYKERTRELVVSLGVPSIYTALSEIDAQTLKEIRSIFNSTVLSLQETMKRQFEEQIIKYQLELLEKQPKRSDGSIIELTFNPLTVSVLSILEMTQLVTAGVIGISEARRIIESMGYGLLRGETFKEEQQEMLEQKIATEQALNPKIQAPKESHPTESKPDKAPNDGRKPATSDSPAKTKAKTEQPSIKRPQPNSPKMGYEDWLKGIQILKEIDKHEAWELLRGALSGGYTENLDEEKENT